MTYVNGASCIAIGVVFMVLGTFAVAARIYVRLVIKPKHLGLDDWLCVPALILTIGCAIDVIVGVSKHAVGYHTNQEAIGLDKVNTLKATSTVFKTVALGSIKLSVLLFYRRVFTGNIFNILSWSMIWIVICWTVALLFANIFPCGTHFAAFWGTSADVNTHCIQTKRLAVGFALSDVIVDVVILFIPLFWIWPLQMPVRQKISVSAIFLIGILAVAAALCRAIVFAGAVFRPYLSPGTILGINSKDILGVLSMGIFWAMIELGVGMVVCCLPSLRPLVFGKSAESLYKTVYGMISLRSVQATRNAANQSQREIEAAQGITQRSMSNQPSIKPSGHDASTHAGRENHKYGYFDPDNDV